MVKNIAVGMNIHRSGYAAYPAENLEKNLDLCKEMGMDYVRYNNSSFSDEAKAETIKVADACHQRGMKIMLVLDGQQYHTNNDIEDLEAYYEEYMYGVGKAYGDKIDVYQLFNEIDVAAMHGDIANIILPGKDGREIGEYDSVRVDKAIRAMKASIKGLKSAYPEAVVCMNFAWWHTAILYEMLKQGCKFDIIGLDWYSDCEEVSDIRDLVAELETTVPDSLLMINETNFWMHPMKRDPIEKQENLKVKELREKNQAEWVCQFIDKLVEMNNPKIIGVHFYELLDEAMYEIRKGSYNGESHFGFIECDQNGNDYVFKPAFYALKEKIKEYN